MASKAQLRARLLAGRSLLRRKTVTLPYVLDEEGKPTVLEVRGLTSGRAFEIRDAAKDEDGKIDDRKLYPALLIESLYLPGTDDMLFSAGDHSALLDWPADMAEQLAAEAAELSGFGLAALKVVEKNSERPPTPTDGASGGPTSSPNGSA